MSSRIEDSKNRRTAAQQNGRTAEQQMVLRSGLAVDFLLDRSKQARQAIEPVVGGGGVE